MTDFELGSEQLGLERVVLNALIYMSVSFVQQIAIKCLIFALNVAIGLLDLRQLLNQLLLCLAFSLSLVNFVGKRR